VGLAFSLCSWSRITGSLEEKLAVARGDAVRGVTYDAGSTTVEEWLSGWLSNPGASR